MSAHKQNILLHACCAPCATSVIETLAQSYEISLFFFNPNIQPAEEYAARFAAVERLCTHVPVQLVVGAYQVDDWLDAVRGLEDEPEGGERCRVCFLYRLRHTARKAAELGIPRFATTLTVSPRKNAQVIAAAGAAVGADAGVAFLAQDFKKHNGFARSCELSRRYQLYRQNYCGCRYSIRD